MARLPRVYIEGILYYVTSKSGHQQNLFEDPKDYDNYTGLIETYKKQYGFRLYSYVLMPTHLHLLIELKNNIPISNIMHDLNSLYTKTYNSRYGTKGHLFQERFKTVYAEKLPYLLPLTRNIHLHPKQAKLVEDLKDYSYSSYPRYIDASKRVYPDMRSEIDEVFGILGGKEKEFGKYVESSDTKETSSFKKKLHQKRILGSEEFEIHIKETIDKLAEQQKKVPEARRMRMSYALIGAFIAISSALTGVYFYRQNTNLMTTLDKTIAMYDSTLQMLKKERDRALQENLDAGQYTWKIRLAEKALEDLKEQKVLATEAEKELEGYAWDITMRKIGGTSGDAVRQDRIFFKNSRIVSDLLNEEGFPGTIYSKTIKDDKVIWETMQTSKDGETASWHGEWNGKIMKGVLSLRMASGEVSDFSFVSSGERIER